MGRISCFTNMIAIDCIRFTKRIDGTKTEGQINMKQPGSYGIDPHLIESSTSFRSINNVTKHTELCAGIGVHGNFCCNISIRQSDVRRHSGAAYRRTGGGGEAADVRRVCGMCQPETDWDRIGKPFSWL